MALLTALRAVAGAVALTIGTLLAPPVAADAASREYELKAAFLYNFTKFIEWPPELFPAPAAPIVIGVYCPKTFVEILSRTVAHRSVEQRAIVVRALPSPEAARGAHLVFVCASADARSGEVLAAVRAQPVVTVGETEAFDQRGGMFTFHLDEGKVRFALNARTVQESGVKVSAQLRKLARSVREY